MHMFKRFEVWLLLIAGVLAVGWALKPSGSEDASVVAEAPEQPALEIRRRTLERDYGNARLDLEIRYRNPSPRPLFMQAPDVRLINAAGREVPPFVLPVERPVSVEPRSTSDVRLRFWLEENDLAGSLTLDVRGEQALVKDAEPTQLEQLKNHQPQVLDGARWKF